MDFNFCKKLNTASGAYCIGDYYAGSWVNDGLDNFECTGALSGPSHPFDASIKAHGITDRDLNLIGITLEYVGAPSGNYVVINVYCNRD